MANTHPHSPDIEKWLRLIRADGVGPVTFRKMLDHFGSVDKALGASVLQFTKLDGIGVRTAERIAATVSAFDPAAELAAADRLAIRLIHLEDPRYPPLLKRIPDAPPVLYVKGTFEKRDNLAIAIVGSRRCSLYGSEQASRFSHILAASGFTIVSGLASGIDTAAHGGALAAGGRTIAVQGCGLASVFPAENKTLFDRIAACGACISELPLATSPLSENFPARNRIIAGLSLATIVVEAANNSGALITARAALEYDREVLALPGKIDSPLSKGPNRLIQEGAKLVLSVEDVLDALGHIGSQLADHVSAIAQNVAAEVEAPLLTPESLNLSQAEKQVYDLLTKEPIHLEDIIAESDLAPGKINAALISLRLKGLIKNLPGNSFAKR